MGKKIGEEKIHKKAGYIYYVGRDGYVHEAKMNRKGRKKGT